MILHFSLLQFCKWHLFRLHDAEIIKLNTFLKVARLKKQ